MTIEVPKRFESNADVADLVARLNKLLDRLEREHPLPSEPDDRES